MHRGTPRTRTTRQPTGDYARQPTGHRILSKACPGFLTVPQGGMSAPPAVPVQRVVRDHLQTNQYPNFTSFPSGVITNPLPRK